MANELPRRHNYAQESVTIFIEKVIGYVLQRSGHDIVLRSQALPVEEVEANILPIFNRSIGETVVSIANLQRERIMDEVNPIWDHVQSLSRSERGDVLKISIIIMGMRILNEDDCNNIYLLMAIVPQLCLLFRHDHPALIAYAVSAMEYVFHNAF